jgi:hypothetical protein
MAGTFYGYAERNADSYVDWYEVGKYTTDMIDETIKVRQEKKDALDKATRDALKQVADTPIGAHASARQAALEMANTVSKNLLIQEKLMKSGRLDPKDYLIYNQNALDSIDLAFNANKSYQENYQKIMDGVKSGDMSGLTLLNAAKAEQYGDWNNMGWQMSSDGNLMVGLKTEQDINGQKVNGLDKITSVNALNGLLLNTIPKNRLEEQTTNWVKTLGKNQIATVIKAGYNKQGMVITREDITKRKDLSADEKTFLFQFVEAEKLKVASLLGTPTNVASILFDTKRTSDSGVDYTATDDPAEAAKDPSKILRVYNQSTGGYEFQVSDKQRAEAERFTFNRMREQYDIIQTANVGSQLSYPPSYMYGGGGKGDEDKKPKVKVNEILINRGRESGKILGISQKLDNLRFEEAEGVENVATVIGYNGETGALEIKGYQVTGKESQGTSEDVSVEGEKGETATTKTVKKGKNVTNRVNFLKSDIKDAPLLSSFVTMIPNPEDENGGNFQNIAQAKAYYKRQYEDRGGDNIPSASNSEWINAGWTQQQINQAVKEGKIKVK